MGLHSRDYARDGQQGGGAFFSPTGGGVVKKIVIATIVVFVLQLLTEHIVVEGNIGRRTDSITENFAVDYIAVTSRGQVWRLLTYAFCHDRGSIWHIVLNLYMLWILGREVEALYGSKEFAWYYGVSAVFASICYLVIGLMLGRRMGVMLGASGAVSAVTMLYALHYPRRKLYIWGILGVEVRILMGLLIVKDALPLLSEFAGRPQVGNVAHACHLGGVLFGFIYFKRQMRLSSLVNGVGLGAFRQKQAVRKSKLKIFNPPEDNRATSASSANVSGEQVDAILAKISEQGEGSLSDREREILSEASRQYRSNR